MALTKREIDRLEYDPAGPKQQIHFDDDLPGFGVRVFPSGVKSFVLWYRTATGRKRLHTIGRFGPMTLEQARKEARAVRAAADAGADPAGERQAARRAETLREFSKVYMERHAKPHKKTWTDDERALRKHILPALGARKLEEISRADVATLHHKLGREHPGGANRVLALVSVMFNLAADWGFLDADAPNPARRIKKFREKSRDRWVTPAELPALVEAIEAEPSIYVRAALKLYLLTGMRRGELLGLRWSDIDLERREIRLGDTKAGRPHIVPLSAEALDVLGTLPRGIGKAFVFPSERNKPGEESKPMVNINKPWRRVRARFWMTKNPEAAAELRAKAEAQVARAKKHAGRGPAAVDARLIRLAEEAAKGEEDVRLHDLRRTVGSWLATSGASLPLIGKVLNHSNASTTQIYARLAEDAARTAIEEHGARIGPLLSGEARAQ